MKHRRQSLINRNIIELIEDIQYCCGEISTRKFTESCKPDDSKLESSIRSGPGSRVTIIWDELGTDEGYIFTLPGFDSNDIYMSGIVHIPEPIGCEKCKCDPEWFHLDRLLANPLVIKVEVHEAAIWSGEILKNTGDTGKKRLAWRGIKSSSLG